MIGTLTRFIYTVKHQSPVRRGMPQIDYDLATIIMPTMALGSGLGVLLNRNMSQFTITLFLSVSLGFSTFKVYKKA